MKINLLKTNMVTQKQILPMQKIRRFFNIGKLKNLVRDVFERGKVKKSEKDIVLKQTPRKYPNCIGTDADFIPTGGGWRVNFYPEDIEKMKNMTNEERLAYKETLLNEGKYFD